VVIRIIGDPSEYISAGLELKLNSQGIRWHLSMLRGSHNTDPKKDAPLSQGEYCLALWTNRPQVQ
jgi:hypothetical protein